jgi:hypothetical protein
MKVTMLLADSAQAVGGKLYILGGGWSVTGPGPSASAIALKIEVPWDETNQRHRLLLKLLDADGHPVLVSSPTGDVPLEIPGEFEVGRPAGIQPGTPIDVPAAISIGPVPIPPGGRYVWRLSIDGRSEPDWEVAFSTRPAAQSSRRAG